MKCSLCLFSNNHCKIFSFFLPCFQKDAMEDSIEIAIEKLLHVTEDIVPKVILFPNMCCDYSCLLYVSLVSGLYPGFQ